MYCHFVCILLLSFAPVPVLLALVFCSFSFIERIGIMIKFVYRIVSFLMVLCFLLSPFAVCTADTVELISPKIAGIDSVFDYASYLAKQDKVYSFKDNKTHELQFSVMKKSYFVFEFLNKSGSNGNYDFVLQYVDVSAESKKTSKVLKHSNGSPLGEVSNNVYYHCRTFQYKGGKEVLLYSVPLVSGIYKLKVKADSGTVLHATLLQNNDLFGIVNAKLVKGGKEVVFELNCAPSLSGCLVCIADSAYDPKKEWLSWFSKKGKAYEKSLCFAKSKYDFNRIYGDEAPSFSCTENGSYTIIVTDPLGHLFLADTVSITQIKSDTE